MNFNDPHQRAIFFDLHSNLPREGPGNREGTARALAMAGGLPPAPRVLDIACGPGMQTMDLAALLPAARTCGRFRSCSGKPACPRHNAISKSM